MLRRLCTVTVHQRRATQILLKLGGIRSFSSMEFFETIVWVYIVYSIAKNSFSVIESD